MKKPKLSCADAGGIDIAVDECKPKQLYRMRWREGPNLTVTDAKTKESTTAGVASCYRTCRPILKLLNATPIVGTLEVRASVERPTLTRVTSPKREVQTCDRGGHFVVYGVKRTLWCRRDKTIIYVVSLV